jgi:hypothetical protein
MAAKLGEAFVELTGRTSGLKTSLDKARRDVDGAAKGMESRLSRVSDRMMGIGRGMSIGVTLPIVAFLGASAKAAADAEAETAKLQAALASTGNATKMAGLDAYAKEMMKLTVFEDEAVKSGMALAHNMGVQADRLPEATRAAIGLATAYQKDLDTGFRMVAMAMGGNYMQLQRLIPELRNIQDPAQKLRFVMDRAAGGFTQAQAAAKTTQGQFAQFQNQMGELKETVGGAFLPVLTDLMKMATSLAQKFSELDPTTQRWSIGLGMVAAATGPLLVALGSVVTAWNTVAAAAKAAWVAQLGPLGIAIAAGSAIGIGSGKKAEQVASGEASKGWLTVPSVALSYGTGQAIDAANSRRFAGKTYPALPARVGESFGSSYDDVQAKQLAELIEQKNIQKRRLGKYGS